MAYQPFYSDIKVFGEISSEKVTITGEYSLPIADGAPGQVLMTDGSGNVNFQTITGFLTTASILNGTGINWTVVSPGVLQGNVTLAPFSTTNLAEGVNLYFTDERVDDRVSTLIKPGLAGTGASSITWNYNDAAGTLTPTVSLTPFSTTNLSEGSNLYFTNERVDDRVATLLQNGTTGPGPAPLTWQYVDNGALPGTLTPKISLASFTTDNLAQGSTNLYYSDELVEDAVADMVQDSATITWTYNDSLGTLTANAVGGVAAINVEQDGVAVGTRNTIDFITGSFTTLSVLDDILNSKITVQYDVNLGAFPDPVIVLGAGTGSSIRKDNCNIASGNYSTVSGGYCNVSSNCASTIGGGFCNIAASVYSTVGGGYCNVASTGSVSSIPTYSLSGALTIPDGTYLISQDSTPNFGSGATFNVTFVGNVVTLIETVYPGINYDAPSDSITTNLTPFGGNQSITINFLVGTGEWSTVSGGYCNFVGSCNIPSTIAGGSYNIISRDNSFIGGGSGNQIHDQVSTISGGAANEIRGYGSTVAGGFCNQISNIFVGTIAGGAYNSATGQAYPTISGGACNTASCYYTTIGGGKSNTALGCNASILGGACNTASGNYSTVGGGCTNSSIGCSSTIAGGELNTTNGDFSFVGGGASNTAFGNFSKVGGGYANCAYTDGDIVGGGYFNEAGSASSLYFSNSITGGYCNSAVGGLSSIVGGCNNVASGISSIVGGGSYNCASGEGAAVLGGGMCVIKVGPLGNTASGYFSMVGAGRGNLASCDEAVAVGGQLNTSSNCYSTVVGGNNNSASGLGSSIIGGSGNTASGYMSTLGGGDENISCNCWSSIGGGHRNLAGGIGSTVAGGGCTNGEFIAGNKALADLSSIIGGVCNVVQAASYGGTVAGGICNTSKSGNYSTVSGGYCNSVEGWSATVSGGYNNYAECDSSTISGGGLNSTSGFYAAIGGGYCNTASGCHSATVSGGRNNTASNCYSTISGGAYNFANGAYSTTVGGCTNVSTGDYSIIGGGANNSVDGAAPYSNIGGGEANCISDCYSTIGGGCANTASLYYSTIGGGKSNCASCYYSTIGGGHTNTASGYVSAIGGGCNNTASSYYSTVSGGYCNTASGCFSAVLGGRNNVMSCKEAGAFGCNITSVCDNTFHVNNLNIYNTPTHDTSNTAVLVRASNGMINYRNVGGLFAQTSTSTAVTATVAETSLLDGGVGSLTVPANGFSVGDSFLARLGGIMSAANGETLQIRIKSGSVVLADTGLIPLPAVTTKKWQLDVGFTVRAIGGTGVASINSNGLFSYTQNSGNSHEGVGFDTINSSTFDTTASNTLTVTAQWGSTNATNTIYSTSFVLTKTY